ncbi:MAG: glutamine amidotransferase [Burkholderiaceae bacterium]|jgi:GMP synthase (glutamine-hydrolysing)|nr:glutamine amidotransferase [Burkholderiaceae bacterium]
MRLIIEMGTPPEWVHRQCGETHGWFLSALGSASAKRVTVVRPYQGEAIPPPTSVSGAIITGSWAMVTDHADWSERTAMWIRQAVGHGLPLLGVCYGHQLMAYALGGEVGDNPAGGETGALPIRLHDEAKRRALLSGFPDVFSAYLSHRQSVLKPPASAHVLASSDKDPCQILCYSDCIWSLQFHPEFTAAIVRAVWEDDHRGKAMPEIAIARQAPWARKILLDFFAALP